MAQNSRCTTCRGLLGPEDAVGSVTDPALCLTRRQREQARADAEAARNPWATQGRWQKAMAMAAVIDDIFRRKFKEQGLDPFDQAFRICDASRDWTDDNWETIGAQARKPNGEHYARKAISEETREAVRSIYAGRAKAPLAARNAS